VDKAFNQLPRSLFDGVEVSALINTLDPGNPRYSFFILPAFPILNMTFIHGWSRTLVRNRDKNFRELLHPYQAFSRNSPEKHSLARPGADAGEWLSIRVSAGIFHSVL
jgi:hypothetical protein